MILDADAGDKLWVYNRTCLHYDLVAREVYAARKEGVFQEGFLPYLVAGLIVFDLGRQMGKGGEQRYLPEEGGFALRLKGALKRVRPHLEPLLEADLAGVNLEEAAGRVEVAYEDLSADGSEGLHADGKHFHVGATKLLHFLNPELFIIIDGNTARAFGEHYEIDFGSGPQTKYTFAKYLDCLSLAQNEMRHFGAGFGKLEPGTPAARVFDKVAFVAGMEAETRPKGRG